MANTVSLGFSKLLKNCGFAQPLPAPKQFWYRNDVLVVVLDVGQDSSTIKPENEGVLTIPNSQFKKMEFAADAIDILKDLSGAKISHGVYGQPKESIFTTCERCSNANAADSVASYWHLLKTRNAN